MIAKPLSQEEIRAISTLGLAYIGDGVYELLVRTWLISHGGQKAGDMHKAAVSYVKASAQAAAAQRILEHLDAEELTVYKRGRNAKVGTVPQGATIAEYHAATGLETLFGHLYVNGKTERIETLFLCIMEGTTCH